MRRLQRGGFRAAATREEKGSRAHAAATGGGAGWMLQVRVRDESLCSLKDTESLYSLKDTQLEKLACIA